MIYIYTTAIYSKSLNNSVGPSNTLRRYENNKQIFLKNGVDLKIFSFENFKKNEGKKKNYDLKFSIKNKLKRLVLFIMHLFPLGSWWIVNQKHTRYSKSIINKFINNAIESDVLVFHELFTCFEFLKKSQVNKARIVLFLHNNGEISRMLLETFPKLKKKKYIAKLEHIANYTLNKVDKLVFISANAKNNFIKLNPTFPQHKVEYILNGVPDIEKSEKEKNFLKISQRNYDIYEIVCVGTLNRRKSQISLVEALSEVSDEMKKKIHITLIGGGTDYNLIKRKIAALKLEKHFTLTGSISNVQDYLLKANIFILPSLDEGLPLSILEAMRFSLPIIGTNVAGIPETIDHDISGIVINTGVAPIISVFNTLDKYDWGEMGRKSRIKFENTFTLERNITNYCAIIKNVI